MIKKYRKKPITFDIKAIQFDGTYKCYDKILKWIDEVWIGEVLSYECDITKKICKWFRIGIGASGVGIVEKNDFVVKDDKGEFQIYEADSFKDRFEEIKGD